MIVAFRSGFLKDVKKIKDQAIRKKLEQLLDDAKKCNSIDELSNLKKMKGYEDFFRVRINNFRVGIVLSGDTIIFSRVLHRKDIYRYFPIK